MQFKLKPIVLSNNYISLIPGTKRKQIRRTMTKSDGAKQLSLND